MKQLIFIISIALLFTSCDNTTYKVKEIDSPVVSILKDQPKGYNPGDSIIVPNVNNQYDARHTYVIVSIIQ